VVEEETVLRDEMTFQDIAMKDGWVNVPQAPGLGVTLNEAAISRYRYWGEIRSTRRVALILAALLPVFAWAAEHETQPSQIIVKASDQFQTISGFGLNFTAPYFREDQKPMFDMFINDLGVTMFRVVPYLVYSDWEVTNDNDDPEVMNWEYYNNRYSSPIFEATWTAIRFLNSRHIRPVIALMGPVTEWMLAKSSEPPRHRVCTPSSQIPSLSPAMYSEFAEEVVSMLMYARSKEKLDFEYFSPFNETDCYPNEGPRIDPGDAPAVLAAVARRLQKEGLGDIKLTVMDQAIIDTDYETPILSNTEVMKHVGALTFHTYGEGSVGSHVARVKASAYPDVPVWLTEYSDLNDRDKTAENDWKLFSLASNRRALTALNQGASALFYFNAFDDYEECARRLTFHGLFHSADQIYYPKKRYFATRQIYHFVHPGSRRIAATVKGRGLTVSAFQDASAGSLVIVGVKEGGANHVQLAFEGTDPTPDHFDLYLTSRTVNSLKQGSVQVRNGMAELDLPDESVFTLVGPVSNIPH
jgi:O-glycosyl hydrolase